MYDKLKCPDCGRSEFSADIAEDSLHLNDAYFEPTVINFEIPVTACRKCGFTFTDHRAELIQEAIRIAFDPAFINKPHSVTKD